ncbi:transcriptional regulator, AraC family [Paenibacillus curdlanolyticus YK9]|uniref:Transcriptional regulator, AraC family n=1 Tax=Paenibacillus curdlanolyticus YK9 TaxID=717606 RepID=E0IAR4_9BACL|nr:DNA-binding response regulator [Paenibacillus curdlanolyticus]EFM10468.1 transcriptional regulator, AraC family [Paenibacillus curdlanolyticus YK9]
MNDRIVLVDGDETNLIRITETLAAIDGVSIDAFIADSEQAQPWLRQHYADICMISTSVAGWQRLLNDIHLYYPEMCGIALIHGDAVHSLSQPTGQQGVRGLSNPVALGDLAEAVRQVRGQIAVARRHEANQLMLAHLSHHRSMLERWLEAVASVHAHVLPVIIVDTLAMLEAWTGERFEPLGELAQAWTRFAANELKKQGVAVTDAAASAASVKPQRPQPQSRAPAEPPQPAAQPLKREDARRHYRLQAVEWLEHAANGMIAEAAQAYMQTKDDPVSGIKSYIEANYARRVTLDELAARVAVSRGHMAKLFKSHTGMTIWAYCIDIRMRAARELLLSTSLKSYEIALRVGYENSIHFSRVFKKIHGMNPIVYRRKFAGKR